MNLDDFCQRFHALVEGQPPIETLIEKGRTLLSTLVSDPEWFRGILEKIVFDRQYLDQQRVSIWPNEITLYRSPDRSFVVLAYFWEARATDVIHDHGSWGIIGELIQPSLERKFRRLDDGQTDGFAELEEISSRVIAPGDTTFVLPLDDGIHQMVNLADNVAVSVNVYGRILRKGYVQFFHPGEKSVSRIYPPRTMKDVLAVRALSAIGRPWAEDMLRARLRDPLPDFLRREVEGALSRINAKTKPDGK
jgi:predicted metal-dependent enzyme (double-stranded beta helix superfamily)